MPAILLIEDDELFRGAVAMALTAHGYAVTEAADGDEGLAKFKAQPADLVLTDIVMPNKEGLATVQELRQLRPKLGIIAMSGGLAKNSPLYLKLAGSFGADRTLEKPFTLSLLFEAVEEVLAKTGHTRPAPEGSPE